MLQVGSTPTLSRQIIYFRFLGGHTPELVYDNLKSVVLQRAEKEIRFNPRFLAFAGFHTFKPVAREIRKITSVSAS